MRNAFLNWIVFVFGIFGLVYLIIVQNDDFVSQIFGICVVSLAIFYFVRFEKELVKKIQQSTASLITFGLLYQYPDEAREPKEEKRVRAEKIFHDLALATIVTISAIALFYNLGWRDFWEDEHQVVSAAAGHYYTGEFFRWDWIKKDVMCADRTSECMYDRAWPHSWLIAQSYRLFGISEWSSRVVSALFMLLTTIGVYFFAKFFTENKNVALVSAFVVAVHPNLVIIGRYTRMYALFIPLFLLLAHCIFRAVSHKIHYGYALGAAITLGIGYFVHINILIILPAVLLFVIYRAATTQKKEYIALSVVGIMGLAALYIIAAFTSWFENVVGFFSFFGRNNTVYLEYVAGFPFPAKFGFAIMVLGFVGTTRFLIKETLKHKLIYLYFISFFALFFFMYIGDRYASFMYTSPITVIFIVLAINSYFLFVDRIRPRVLKILFILALLINPAYVFYENRSEIYEGEGFGKISIAYASIAENIKPGEVIFGQYLRDYYLQSIDPQTPRISMLNNQSYSYQSFREDLARYESGWITWETRKRYHIQPEIRDFAQQYLTKIHGAEADASGVELYYFSTPMLPPTNNL